MPAQSIIRVDPETRDRLQRLSAARGTSVSALVAALIRDAEDTQLLADMNDDFRLLNEDRAARALYDASLITELKATRSSLLAFDPNR